MTSSLRDEISDLITNELFERFESPSSAVIGVKLADRIIELIEKRQANPSISTHSDTDTTDFER